MTNQIYIAKTAAQLTVSYVATKLIASAISTVTNADEDSFTTILAAGVGGSYVAYKLSPQTDALIEAAADKLYEYRQNHRTEEQQA